MLKIKDNIDLKELEKFGFENGEVFYRKAWFIGREAQAYIVVDKDTNEIRLNGNSYTEDLFDLIQAGFVEKVGE